MEKKEKGFIGELVVIGVFLCFFIVLIGNYTQSIKVSGTINCNSGFVGLDLEAYNNIQNKTCEHDGNYTCFKEDMLLNHFKIKNIDNLNCNINYEGKIPGGILHLIE